MYWPKMTTETKNLVNSHRTYQKFKKSNPKEAMIPYCIPIHPWIEVGINIMYLKDLFTRC